MLKRFGCLLCLIAAPAFVSPATAQQRAGSGESGEKPDEGIVVTSDLVKRKCGTCHRADEQGRLSRIS
jgi:mono/diheme cytochrome c family protein